MKVKKVAIGILVMIGLLVGSLGAGAILAGKTGHVSAAPSAQSTDACAQNNDGQETVGTAADKDNVQQEVQCGAQDGSEAADTNEAGKSNETAETAETGETAETAEMAPAGLAITADQAQAIVETANPGAATLAVEYDRENGSDLYSVKLDNGQNVTVDAATGAIVATEADD